MKLFLLHILTFSTLALLFVPAHADENETPSEEPALIQTEDAAHDEATPAELDELEDWPLEEKTQNTCLEQGENCGGANLKEERDALRGKFRTNIEGRLNAIRAQAEERKESRRIRVSEGVQGRMEQALGNTITRFEQVIQRLSSIADRAENRLTEMQERGFDVTTSFEALDHARNEIAFAAEAIARVALSVDDALTSENPAGARAALRVSLSDTRGSLQNAREALLQAITEGQRGMGTTRESEGGGSGDSGVE